MSAATESNQLHIFFFPHMAQGHMMPMADMAELFALRGVKATIVTTPLNLPFFSKSMQKAKELGISIDVLTVKFPNLEAGIPEECENVHTLPSMGSWPKFAKAMTFLEQPLEQLLKDHRPHCLVADMFFPWTTDLAAKLGIPRLVFHGTSFFSMCAEESVRVNQPHRMVSSDSEPFTVPNLPDEIQLTPQQLPTSVRQETFFSGLARKLRESEERSYGVVGNSFYELEHAYVDHLRKVLGRRAWPIGPLSLSNQRAEDKERRGFQASTEGDRILKWLDTKDPNSVLYVCFGSMASFPATQLREIAMGLEASGLQFLWVVKTSEIGNSGKEEWLPEGFESRMEGKGLIVRGWAPQLLILDHAAIGGFMTHCGWNSTLEGVAAGVPMVTWPFFAEQFYNESLITQILKIGVEVGAKQWAMPVGDGIGRDAVKTAVTRVMVGDEAEAMRSKAKALGEKAKAAIKEGGLSYHHLNELIEELKPLVK